MAQVGATLKQFRAKFTEELANKSGFSASGADAVLAIFDEARADILSEIVDGNPAESEEPAKPKPRKPRGPNKKKAGEDSGSGDQA